MFISLHKKGSFHLRISSVNVTSANPLFPVDLVTFIEEILNGKLDFLCRVLCWGGGMRLAFRPSETRIMLKA